MAVGVGVLVVVVLVALAAAGAGVAVWGWRGRVVDDHPVCRGCGFDLFGRPAGVGVCSECGADVTAPGAVRVGNRRGRPGAVMAGVMLLALGVGGLVAIGWGAARGVRWVEYGPTWVLVRQARQASPAVRGPALDELVRRASARKLSDGRVGPLVETALAVQADASAEWDQRWGDLVELARGTGRVSDEQWRRYLAQAPRFELSVRPEARAEDRVVMQLREGPSRCGGSGTVWARVRVKVLPDSDVVSKTALREERMGGSSLSVTISTGWDRRIELDPKRASAAAGPKTLRVAVTAEMYSSQQAALDGRTPEATVTRELKAGWTLVPAGRDTVRAIDDELGVRAAVEKAITVWVPASSKEHVSLSVNLNRPPVPLAYRVVVRSGEREWATTGVHVRAGRQMNWAVEATITGLDAERVDVIFRPDAQVAMETLDLTEYWGGEVVVKDVPLRRGGR